MPILMHLRAIPNDDQYHLEGHVAHYGRPLARPHVELTLAGKTETVPLTHRGVVAIDRLVPKPDLEANLTVQARYHDVGDQREPAGEYQFDGVFEPEPWHRKILLLNGIAPVFPSIDPSPAP